MLGKASKGPDRWGYERFGAFVSKGFLMKSISVLGVLLLHLLR